MQSVNGTVHRKAIGKKETQKKKVSYSKQKQSRKRRKQRKLFLLKESGYGQNSHLSLLQDFCFVFLSGIVLLMLCNSCSGDYRYVADQMREYHAKLISWYEDIETCVERCIGRYVFCKKSVCSDANCIKDLCKPSYSACIKSDCVAGR